MKAVKFILAVLLVAGMGIAPVVAQRTTNAAVTAATFSLQTSARLSKVTFNKADYKFVDNMVNFPSLAVGNYEIILQATGMENINAVLSVALAGSNATVQLIVGKDVIAQQTFPATTLTIIPVPMKPALYSLTVNSNVRGASVQIDKTSTTAGTAVSLPAGTYDVTVRAPGHTDATQKVTVSANSVITVNLVPLMGKVTVNMGTVTGQIFVNNALQRTNSFDLAPGTYTIKIVVAGLESSTQVTVQANQTITLSPAFSIRVN